MTREKATEWVNAAIELSLDPQLVIQPDGSEGVFCRESRKGHPGPLTDDLIDNVIVELRVRGRVQDHRTDAS